MAFEVYDDYEQNERVVKWLRENGLSIVIGIVIGLVGIFGWQQWRAHQVRTETAAAGMYQQVQTALASNQADTVARVAGELMKEYPKSTYAVFAASDLARQQASAGDLDKAASSLQWGIGHVGDKPLKPLLQIRLARVELARGDGKVALTTLDAIPAGGFVGLVQELRGDALVKLGRAGDARKAYEAAMSALAADAPERGALKMKLDDLATPGESAQPGKPEA
ncbi:MAG TPA: tetratricopeptide repeat protein [Rhodanobacter sp.]|jgi:predicted negative regulator of RcsB-dependent stress response|nr:tetratricopeptide repeat protein [Rhodanobacter sp.]